MVFWVTKGGGVTTTLSVTAGGVVRRVIICPHNTQQRIMGNEYPGQPRVYGWDQHLSHRSFLCCVRVIPTAECCLWFYFSAKHLKPSLFHKGDVNHVSFPLWKLCGRLAAHMRTFIFTPPRCCLVKEMKQSSAQHPCLYDSFGNRELLHPLRYYSFIAVLMWHIWPCTRFEHIINIVYIHTPMCLNAEAWCSLFDWTCWWVIDECYFCVKRK